MERRLRVFKLQLFGFQRKITQLNLFRFKLGEIFGLYHNALIGGRPER